MIAVSFLFLCLCVSHVIAFSENTARCFKSRPDICVPVLNVTHYEAGQVSPGYLFIGPIHLEAGLSSTPCIYDNLGELVWSGVGINEGEVYDFSPCQLSGKVKLCLLDMRIGIPPKALGPMLIIDEHLKDVQTFEQSGNNPWFDQHELKIVNNGASILVIFYKQRPWNLSSLGGSSTGYVVTSQFQEIDLDTHNVNFSWDALDHVDLEKSYMELGSTKQWGDGSSPSSAWDYFHLNSVDKNKDGDYLVSSRHTSTVYKISGTNGTILWRLGGKASDFSFEPGLNFSSQHHAQWLESSTGSVEVLSLFNNAFDKLHRTALSSSGLVLHLDMETMHASLVSRYPAPHDLLSHKEGSVDILPNGNALCYWGGSPFFTEHTGDGSQVAWAAHFADQNTLTYRAYKANFTATPSSNPDVLSIAHSRAGPTVWYISWNGATEVRSWRIYASPNGLGDLKLIGAFERNGFETRIEIDSFFPWAIIEAIDERGNGIRNTSSVVRIERPYMYPSRNVGQVVLAS